MIEIYSGDIPQRQKIPYNLKSLRWNTYYELDRGKIKMI